MNINVAIHFQRAAHTKTKSGFIASPFSRAHCCYPPWVLAGSEGYCGLFAGGQTKSSVLQTLNHVLGLRLRTVTLWDYLDTESQAHFKASAGLLPRKRTQADLEKRLLNENLLKRTQMLLNFG